MQSQNKLECQDAELYQLQQQVKDLQQRVIDNKNDHKQEIAKINQTVSKNNDEIFRLRNHNKILVTKIKKIKK